MATATLSNKHTDFMMKYRAVCEEDKYRGPWRDDVELAKADARRHRAQSPGDIHIIRIVAQQTLTMQFDD